MTSHLAGRWFAAGPVLLLAVATGCASTSSLPGVDRALERAKLADILRSPVVTAPLVPGAPRSTMLSSAATSYKNAVVARYFQLPGGVEPRDVLGQAVQTLQERGMQLALTDCSSERLLSARGDATIDSSVPGTAKWYAEVEVFVDTSRSLTVRDVGSPLLEERISVSPGRTTKPAPHPAGMLNVACTGIGTAG